jgi:hypothetical protein
MNKEVETKVCTKCPSGQNIKPLTEFYVCKGGKIRPSCKKCDNAMTRAYKARNKKHISQYNQKYKKVHRKEISKYNHLYNKNNRDAIQKRQTAQHKERKKTDFNYLITSNLRSMLYDFISSKGSKGKRTPTIIGCNYESLVLWFTFLFDDKMTFDNYGKYWSVDHVYPCSKYTFEENENIYECFNWRNLRPLKILDNQKKINKIDNEDLTNHVKLIKQFWNILPEEEKDNYI